MWVKICANTNAEDALAAAEAGADALGFVFAPSQRRVTAEQVAAMADLLPQTVERVGVFAGQRVGEIAEGAKLGKLHAVQLHGGLEVEARARLRDLLGPEISIIDTVSWKVGEDGQAERVADMLQAAVSERSLPRILVDAQVGAASGGLGVSFDWSEARRVFEAFAGRVRLVLAGGLRPETVGEAIRLLHPWGLDVASGVEAQPGCKDHVKLREFLREARRNQAGC